MNTDQRNPLEVPDLTERSEELPPCLIRVDLEGRLWHLGAEMTHQGINQLLMEHVELDDNGRYVITFRDQRCVVDVEDTFFVVRGLEAHQDGHGQVGALTITLNDDSREELDPATLVQNQDNVMYARVKGGRFPARFLRPSYYQLAEHVTEKGGRIILTVGGRDYDLS